jgi:AsmA protein
MKKILIGISVVVVLLLVIAVAIPFFVDANKFRPRVEQEASAALGRKVSIGHLSLSILRGSVIAKDVQVSDDPKFSNQPFMQAKSLSIGAELMPLVLRKEMKINSIRLDQPQIQLVKNGAGKWNFESLGAGAPKQQASGTQPPLSVSSLKIANGEITVSQGNKKNTYTNVNAEVSNFSDASEFPFNVSLDAPGGGSVKLDGRAGPLAKGEMTETPMHAEVAVKNLDLAETGFLDASSGMAGTLDYQGQVKSDGKTLESEGKATATNLKLVKGGAPAKQPITVDYATEYDVA